MIFATELYCPIGGDVLDERSSESRRQDLVKDQVILTSVNRAHQYRRRLGSKGLSA